MYFLRFTDDKSITTSFNHFDGTELNGVCAYALENIDDNGLRLEIRNNVNSTYQKYYEGKFIVFTGKKLGDNFNGEGVIARMDEIIAEGVVSEGNYGWVISQIEVIEEYKDL